MWILLRLLIAAAAFAVRYFQRASRPKPAGEIAGTPYFLKLHRGNYRRIKSFEIGVALPAKVLFRLQKESASDHLFKRLGLAQELQTGDVGFDERVYVACDHPALHQLLREDVNTRRRIVQALEMGFDDISSDGEVLWLERAADREPNPAELRLLAKLGGAFSDLESRMQGWHDPFAAKTVVVEAVVWSILAYAVSAFVALSHHTTWEYFQKTRLFGFGLLVAAVLFGVLFAWVMTWMRGSSRGHRILVESAIVLALGLPVTGTQIVSDLNQNVGDPEKTVVRLEVSGTRVEKHRRRRRTKVRYFVDFTPVAESQVAVPRTLRVEEELHHRAAAGQTAELHVAMGWLGIPWLEKIELR